jgi:hypothetical protein
MEAHSRASCDAEDFINVLPGSTGEQVPPCGVMWSKFWIPCDSLRAAKSSYHVISGKREDASLRNPVQASDVSDADRGYEKTA